MKHAANTGADNGFDWRDTLIWCGVPVAIVLLVRMFLIGFYVIPSGSMMDTIEPGDRVITTKLTPKLFSLRRGDVVVFKDPDHWLQEENSGRLGGDFLIKRLIGLPGDTVACEGPGQPVTVNVHSLRRGPEFVRFQGEGDGRPHIRVGRQSREFRRFPISSG